MFRKTLIVGLGISAIVGVGYYLGRGKIFKKQPVLEEGKIGHESDTEEEEITDLELDEGIPELEGEDEEEKLEVKAKKPKLVSTEGWGVYQNEKTGFFMKHPKTWIGVEKGQAHTPVITVSFFSTAAPDMFSDKSQVVLICEDNPRNAKALDLEEFLLSTTQMLGSAAPMEVLSKGKRLVDGRDAYHIHYCLKSPATPSTPVDEEREPTVMYMFFVGISTPRRMFLFQMINLDKEIDMNFAETLLINMKISEGRSFGVVNYRKGKFSLQLPEVSFTPQMVVEKDILFRLGEMNSDQVWKSLVLRQTTKEEVDENKEEYLKLKDVTVLGKPVKCYAVQDKENDSSRVFCAFLAGDSWLSLEVKFPGNSLKKHLFKRIRSCLESFQIDEAVKDDRLDGFTYGNKEYMFSLEFPLNHCVVEHCQDDPLLMIVEEEAREMIIETIVSIRDLPGKITEQELLPFLKQELKNSQGMELVKEEAIDLSGTNGVRFIYTQFDVSLQTTLKFFSTSVVRGQKMITVRSYGVESHFTEDEVLKKEKIHNSLTIL